MFTEDDPIFSIAHAAELAAMHPQTLRQYDRLGLVSPGRTAGRTRRYSMRDIVQLREVQRLSNEGLNLEGIRRILELENTVTDLNQRVRELESLLADAMNTMCERIEDARARAARDAEGRSQAVEQLRHAERLATVGTLASGVAHELGTPLMHRPLALEARALDDSSEPWRVVSVIPSP